MVPISLFCGLLLFVGVQAYDPVNWFTNQTYTADLFRAQLDDLVSTILNFADLESIAEKRDDEFTRQLENLRFHPLSLHELSVATDGICRSLHERIMKLSDVINYQTESYEQLVTKLREAMAYFTRFDHLPASLREEKYAMETPWRKKTANVDLKSSGYTVPDTGKTEETIEYLSGVTEIENLFDLEATETGVTDTSDESDYLLEDRIGSSQEFEETLDVISIPGIPGEDFPNYEEIPKIAFSCEDKEYVPGFYADRDASCQVFHVCWSHHRETFLCPTGSTFNQELLFCDFWYKSNCSLSQSFYDANAKYLLKDSTSTEQDSKGSHSYDDTLLLSSNGVKFYPTKFQTYNYPEGKRELDGTRNLFNWKIEQALKMKAKSEDVFEDTILQDKDWIRDHASVHIADEEILENVSEQTTSESTNYEIPFQSKFKGKKASLDVKSKSKSDRSGFEAVTSDPESSTDSTQIFEKDLDVSSTDSEESTQFTEHYLNFTPLVSVESAFSTPNSIQESTTPASIISNTRKLKPLFPKLKDQKFLVGKENIAPAIIQHVLNAADNIINDGILPLTKQILAESYSKYHKGKH